MVPPGKQGRIPALHPFQVALLPQLRLQRLKLQALLNLTQMSSDDVFLVELTDTDGDNITFMLIDADVQQYVNGNLEIAQVKSLYMDESSGAVADSKGRFTVQEP